MRVYSKYQEWIISNFNGKTPKESISKIAEILLFETKQQVFPIKLSLIAKKIGIDPRPLYLNQPFDGSLIFHGDKLRIALKRESEQYNRLLPHYRFAYAHELIHCLSYDFNIHKRVAPLPKGLEEEHLCNYGAVKLILPLSILKKYLKIDYDFYKNDIISYTEKIKQLATLAECNIHTVVYELFNSDLLVPTFNTVYILSQNSGGYQNKNVVKPRCLIGIHFDEQGKKKQFLSGQQGLQHIKSLNSNEGWSLINFYQNPFSNHFIVDNETILRDTDNEMFLISGIHVRFSEKGYIWSELNIKKA